MPWLLLVDLVLVVAFACVGRASHDESLDALGIATTTWPFLVGAIVGHLATRAWRKPTAIWPVGVVVWIAAVVVGMLLRLATGQGTAPAFVIVATVTLGVLLLGWRLVSALVRRATTRARATPGT